MESGNLYKVYTLEEAMKLTNRLPKGNKPFVVLDEDNLCLSTYDTLSDANQDVCKYNIQEEAVADLVSLLRNARTTMSAKYEMSDKEWKDILDTAVDVM